MKLFLTSNGLSNDSISQAFFEFIGKKPEDTIITFVPTAMHLTEGGKEWFVDDLYNIAKQGIKEFDIADISSLPETVWLPRLEKADVLFFSGGYTNYLMDWINKSGLKKKLPGLLENRVYAGISAGSMVTNPELYFSSEDKKTYYEEIFDATTPGEGLGFVDFFFRPHLNSLDFPHTHEDRLAEVAKKTNKKVYALDDESAMAIVDGKVIDIVSEGTWKIFNG